MGHVGGSAQAINAGDLLYAVAIVSMSNLDQRGVSAGNTVKAIRRLEQTCIQVIEGQYLDMEFESRLDVSPDEYLEMIGKKSAALISFPMEVGALFGGADERLQLALRRGWQGHRHGVPDSGRYPGCLGASGANG